MGKTWREGGSPAITQPGVVQISPTSLVSLMAEGKSSVRGEWGTGTPGAGQDGAGWGQVGWAGWGRAAEQAVLGTTTG